MAAVPSAASAYDANDRLTSDIYDANGNTTASSGKTYAYDFENRLTQLTDGGNGASYIYDGDGNRVGKVTNGVTTNYLVDTNNLTGYAQVVEEIVNGNVTKQFTYGHDLISQRCPQPTANCTLSFYGYDGHGSVRLLTSASGVVTDTYDYDAFGNLISRTGTTENEYLYTGERFDGNLGFYYLRARYMNPGSGRFFTQDSYEGDYYDPFSLHKYRYVNANPINLHDPSGYTAGVLDFTGAFSISSILVAISGIVVGIAIARIKEELDKANFFLYREADNPNHPKSVALRRMVDWQTGLSFSTIKPKGNYIKYRVKKLLSFGYIIREDGGQVSVDVHTGQPLPELGTRVPGHVALWLVFLSVWDSWYETEQGLKGTPNYSLQTHALFDLRERP